MKKIVEFQIDDDQKNKGQKILVAIDEEGQKWVVSGNPHFPTALIKYEDCWYTKEN